MRWGSRFHKSPPARTEMTAPQHPVRFAPWVGARYTEGVHGLRMLLVCESHYGRKEHERPTVTPEIIKALALGQVHPLATAKPGKHAHFTKIRAAVMKARPDGASLDTLGFWQCVAYYNYLQEFVSACRKAPPQSAWGRSESAFSEVVSVLAPDLIVCFSKRNGKKSVRYRMAYRWRWLTIPHHDLPIIKQSQPSPKGSRKLLHEACMLLSFQVAPPMTLGAVPRLLHYQHR